MIRVLLKLQEGVTANIFKMFTGRYALLFI